ncbi:hypothetical protein Lnau_2091 [Legionella nautarum]|uniref:DUF1868 domain-containing protein n=1 Tax=Legionella nautarum TaxID=45070 RepID=A0A0W0WN75_9GAMM|nr:DUF1868 domain-containing protein [Legionella nautarum]KTD33799.1 hypothetical protein Lnau_2091 [Legionella nautarum]
MVKINKDGKYTPYPGVTVIAGIGDNDNEFWQTLYQKLNSSPLICKYFKPLPYQSYHMTTCNLYVKEWYFSRWSSFINQKLHFLQQLHVELSKTPIIPEITIEDLNVSDVLQLNVSLPPDQEEEIKAVAKQFGLEKKVPEYFHITLGYLYNFSINEEDFAAIKNECTEILATCLKKEKLYLDSPQLTFFHSMKKFIPWDGKQNPFLESSSNQSTFFNSRQSALSNIVSSFTSYVSQLLN